MKLYGKLNKLLADSGLNEAEVMVYLELLKKPAESIWNVVERTGLSKSTVYRAFDELKKLKIIGKNENSIRSLSLKNLIAELNNKDRKLRKTVLDLKKIAPFLHMPNEEIESFETMYSADQIKDAYIFMSELDYGTNFDFGDFENFAPLIGGLETTDTFRKNRIKHAGHYAICTTFGPHTAHYSTRAAARQFKNKVDMLNLDFKNRWIIFSDTKDYVMFNNFEDPDNISAVLVKSKVVADSQREQFRSLSRRFGN